MLEQVAKPRNASEERNLSNADRVISFNHATDYHRSTVSDQYLGGGLLGDQGWVAVNLMPKVRRGVFNIHVEEDGVLDRNLRSHGQLKECVNIGNGRRGAEGCCPLDGNTHPLPHDRLNIILGHHPWT